MHDGDGTTQGNCDSGFLCYADGNCKGKIWAFIVTLYIRNGGIKCTASSMIIDGFRIR